MVEKYDFTKRFIEQLVSCLREKHGDQFDINPEQPLSSSVHTIKARVDLHIRNRANRDLCLVEVEIHRADPSTTLPRLHIGSTVKIPTRILPSYSCSRPTSSRYEKARNQEKS